MYWEPSEEWVRTHTTADLRYVVNLEFSSWQVAKPIWEAIARGRQVEGQAVLIGGAYIEYCAPAVLEVVSEGEDGLDSLAYAMNDVLYATMAALAPDEQPKVVRELRQEL